MPRLITDYLENTAARFPDKTAIVDDEKELTFAQLRDASRRVASGLLQMGIFHQPVAVYLEQSAESIVPFLGAAYSGNFYTVLDSKMPVERLRKITEVLEPAAILTDGQYFEDAQIFAGGGTKILLLSNLLQSEAHEDSLAEISGRISSLDVLYVLFTSGSTGVPKGVTIGQRSVMDYTDWVTETFGVDEHTVLGNQAPFYFDNSVLDIYQMVSTGATLHIIPRKLFAFPLRLMEYVREHGVNMIFWVPSLLCTVANFEILEACDISCLKKVLFAGEVMPNKQLNVWRRALPEALFANLYGPTEITVDCTYYVVDREFEDGEPLPIGITCRNSTILVLDENNRLVEGGAQGELCVRGTSLAYGYYRNPEKTAEVFVQNPLQQDYPEIIYRTGDLVHYNERGELMYDGRKDFQIKHMGHRIELGEIETAASSLTGVDGSCCIFDKNRDILLLCYAGQREEKEVRRQLLSLLPEYMVPRQCHRLDSLPLNQNGKIDRVKLKEMFCPA